MTPIVVVGASAGGLEPLTQLVAALPPDFPGAVCAVLHLAPHVPSQLPQILGRAGPLPALHPEDGEAILPGHIYVAPPDRHLLVEDGHLGVKSGPKENRFRPSVDALFRSAAYTRGAGVIGVVLSGVLDDGTSGLWTVKRLGGVAVVQDPAEAQFSPMPQSALQHVAVDHVLPAAEIGSRLTALVRDLAYSAPTRPAEDPMNEDERRLLDLEVRIAAGDHALDLGLTDLARPSPLTCPECQGVLFTLPGTVGLRYRCHTGHAYTADALLAEIGENIEAKLYQVLRTVEEGLILLRRMESAAREAGGGEHLRLKGKVAELEGRARQMHRLTQRGIYDNDVLTPEG